MSARSAGDGSASPVRSASSASLKCALVVACEDRRLRDAGMHLLLEACRMDLAEPVRGLFSNSSASSKRPARAAARPRLRRLIIERPRCPAASTISCTERKSSSASVDPPLVGQDLADVVHRHRDACHVADPLEQRPTPLVVVERLRPLAVVVLLDAEVVQHGRLALEIAEILEDREREPAERYPLG